VIARIERHGSNPIFPAMFKKGHSTSVSRSYSATSDDGQGGAEGGGSGERGSEREGAGDSGGGTSSIGTIKFSTPRRVS
jgi:hypothetical protein